MEDGAHRFNQLAQLFYQLTLLRAPLHRAGMNSIAADSSLAVSLIVLSAIFASMPLGLINVALAASKCQQKAAFTIHAVLLVGAALVAISLMIVDLPDDLVKALARSLPIGLFLQTLVLFFRRDQSTA